MFHNPGISHILLFFKVTCMREILAEAWPSETLGLGGIFRIISGKVNHHPVLKSTLTTGKVPRNARLLPLSYQHWRRGQPVAEGNLKIQLFSFKLGFSLSVSLKLWCSVLRDGRPSQCALRLCLKVAKSILQKGMFEKLKNSLKWKFSLYL